MRKITLASIALGLAMGAMALSGGKPPQGDLVVEIQDRNPWTNLRLNNEPETFHFAIVSDRTGGHRARIFSMAVDQLNLLQPSFVLSVGDLIEGYTKSKEKIDAEWKDLQSYVAKLQMPFFYVPGNHDITNSVMEADWKERFGRRYYHFVYKNILFLCLHTSDPSDEKASVQIGKEQLEYFQKVLKENQHVRWTIVAMHKPMWIDDKLSTNGFLEMEKMLQGRPYTAFAGHVHRYQKFIRHGMNYYMLATTGGGSKLRGPQYGEFDHLVWVTMKKDSGPVLANIMLDGIYAEDLKKTFTDEDGHVRTNVKPTYPVRGKVMMDGAPVSNAYLIFYYVDPDPKKAPQRIADAIAAGDGSFVLSSYAAGDGAPAGSYIVTAVLRQPFYDPDGKLGKNRLPAKYASPKESDLRAVVRNSPNDLLLELKSR